MMPFIAHSHVTDVHMLVVAAVSTKGRYRGRVATLYYVFQYG